MISSSSLWRIPPATIDPAGNKVLTGSEYYERSAALPVFQPELLRIFIYLSIYQKCSPEEGYPGSIFYTIGGRPVFLVNQPISFCAARRLTATAAVPMTIPAIRRAVLTLSVHRHLYIMYMLTGRNTMLVAVAGMYFLSAADCRRCTAKCRVQPVNPPSQRHQTSSLSVSRAVSEIREHNSSSSATARENPSVEKSL